MACVDESVVRVYVELAGSLDVPEWAARHEAGLVPDASPYGLHRMVDDHTAVAFRRPLRGARGERLRHRLHGRLEGIEIVDWAADIRSRLRRTADVCLAMDERTGIPACLFSRRPVLMGVAWLEDPAQLPGWYVATARAALRRAAGVFTQCDAMVEPLTSAFGVDPERIGVVRLGIDTAHFHPAPQPGGPPTVFSVGDDRMRDHPALIAACRAAQAEVPELRLELATTLPVEVPPSLGVTHRRRMDEAVRQCYARSNVVAIALRPTRQGSGLTVILEAMASGRPVVVTDNPGLSRYVEDGVSGLLVPPGNDRAMADAIASLIRNPRRAEAMGRAARARVEACFTSAHMAADLRDLAHRVAH